MERRSFIQKSVAAGLGCACIAPVLAGKTGHSDFTLPGETPCQEKIEFAKKWVSRLFTVIDNNLDEETRNSIMRQNGESCYKGDYGEPANIAPRTLDEIDKNIAELNQYLGKDNPRREGKTIYFEYVGNPNGLKVADGYCLCPLVEDGPKTLSPTFCQCSVGYVGLMFKKITGRNVQVDLLESLRNGGKKCRFKVMFEV